MANRLPAVVIILLAAMFIYAFSLILTGDNYVSNRTTSWGTVFAGDDPPPPPPDSLQPPPDSEHPWQDGGTCD